MESAITNNISMEDAEKHDTTSDSMFAKWMALFRSHVQGRCEFTIEPNVEITARVRDWYSLCELMTEICPDIYTRNRQWLGTLIQKEK